MTKHLVLLGDSIFDNGSYVLPGQADVTAHLARKLPPEDWTVDMRAVDGAVTTDVQRQINNASLSLPCTFVLSAGGNDALQFLEIIEDTTPGQSVASVLLQFHEIKEGFRSEYSNTLDGILEHGQHLIVCTIYNPNFPEPDIQKLAVAGLSFFNDVITEEALRRRLPIIDLRNICAAPEAFANPIEPSEVGGDLITDAIISFL